MELAFAEGILVTSLHWGTELASNTRVLLCQVRNARKLDMASYLNFLAQATIQILYKNSRIQSGRIAAHSSRLEYTILSLRFCNVTIQAHLLLFILRHDLGGYILDLMPKLNLCVWGGSANALPWIWRWGNSIPPGGCGGGVFHHPQGRCQHYHVYGSVNSGKQILIRRSNTCEN